MKGIVFGLNRLLSDHFHATLPERNLPHSSPSPLSVVRQPYKMDSDGPPKKKKSRFFSGGKSLIGTVKTDMHHTYNYPNDSGSSPSTDADLKSQPAPTSSEPAGSLASQKPPIPTVSTSFDSKGGDSLPPANSQPQEHSQEGEPGNESARVSSAALALDKLSVSHNDSRRHGMGPEALQKLVENLLGPRPTGRPRENAFSFPNKMGPQPPTSKFEPVLANISPKPASSDVVPASTGHLTPHIRLQIRPSNVSNHSHRAIGRQNEATPSARSSPPPSTELNGPQVSQARHSTQNVGEVETQYRQVQPPGYQMQQSQNPLAITALHFQAHAHQVEALPTGEPSKSTLTFRPQLLTPTPPHPFRAARAWPIANLDNSGITSLPLHATLNPIRPRPGVWPEVPAYLYTSPNRISNALTASRKRKRSGTVLPPPAFIYQRTNNPDFNIFPAFLLYPELCYHLATHLPLEDLISLYAISRDFHTILDNRFTTVILSQSLATCPESSRVFPFRCYAHLCRRDPVGRIPHPDPAKAKLGLVRAIPSFRWLRMVMWREAVVHEIMAIMAEDGCPLPRRCELALKRMWVRI